MSHGDTFGVAGSALNRCKQAPVQRKLRMRSATTFACVSHTKCPAPGMISKFGKPAAEARADGLVASRRCTGAPPTAGVGSSGPPLTASRNVRR